MLQQGVMIDLKSGNPVAGSTLGQGNNLVSISNSGEINANDVNEALRAIQNLQSLSSNGSVQEVQTPKMKAEAAAMRQQSLADAVNDPQAWQALGSALAERIEEQSERNGFLRRLANSHPLSQGQVARIPMEQQVADAIIATADTQLEYQLLRGKIFNPPEFEIKAHIRVAQIDLEQVSGDLLDQAYQQGLESIMVKEDRLWKQAADQTVGLVNPLTEITGGLTPGYLSRLRNHVSKWNLPVTTALISNDYWDDIHGNPEWATMLDPITRHDLVLHGQIATLQGMTLITDGFRAPNQVVLKPGEIYCVADSKYHATYTTRGGVRSKPTDGSNSGETTQGWLLWQMFSFTMGNMRSVSKGVRS